MWLIQKPLYVLGQLDTRHEQDDAETINRDVRTILADLKTRPQQLLLILIYLKLG